MRDISIWKRKTNALLAAVRVRGGVSACANADGTPSGVLPLKMVSQCREQAGRVYNVAAFEIKKEIPIQIGLVLWSRGGVAV
jgi:hypothetical protein